MDPHVIGTERYLKPKIEDRVHLILPGAAGKDERAKGLRDDQQQITSPNALADKKNPDRFQNTHPECYQGELDLVRVYVRLKRET